jgi:hypothetical protein
MGGALSYVPREVLEKYKDDAAMAPVLQTYGGLRKHEVGMDDLYLFDTIAELKKCLVHLKEEMEQRKTYAESLEAKLATAHQTGDK